MLEIIGELLIQLIGEALVQLGLHSLAEPLNRPPNPWLAALGYFLFGAMLGGGSLWLFPGNLVPEPWRVANLIVTPLVVGAMIATMGAWRARRGLPVLRIDRFAYGYLFALALAIVRYYFAA